MHIVKNFRLEEPGEHLGPADPERIVEVLARPGTEAVERKGEGSHTNFGHWGIRS
jgi:hypothetical protein